MRGTKRKTEIAIAVAAVLLALAAGIKTDPSRKDEAAVEQTEIQETVCSEQPEEKEGKKTDIEAEQQEQPEYIPSTQAAEGYLSELRLIEITEEIGNEYNICPELLQAIAYKESELYIDATNGSCKGIMQVNSDYMAERMEKLGVTDIYDVYGNMLLAADYIAELRDTTEHGDDLYYVLMRYNMRTDTANELYAAGTVTDYAKSVAEHSAELERLHGK